MCTASCDTAHSINMPRCIKAGPTERHVTTHLVSSAAAAATTHLVSSGSSRPCSWRAHAGYLGRLTEQCISQHLCGLGGLLGS